MDTETVTTDVTSTEATTDASTDTSTRAESTTGDVGSADAGATGYTPNYGFKVMDQSHEIPEQFRAIIKDADTEKMAREVFEKAYGLDFVKPKYESLKGEYETLQGEYNPIKEDLALLAQWREKQDVGSIMESLGLTDEALIKHAMERIEYHQMAPEKRNQLDQQRQQNFEYYKTQQELNKLKAEKAQGETNGVFNELQGLVRAPHVHSIAENFNRTAGQPDGFEKAVVAHAQAHFAMYKQDLSVQQAVESFIKTFGLAGSSQTTTSAVGQAGPQTSDRQATLPKSGGNTVSPVKPKVQSIADLRKLQQKAYESQG